MILKIALRKDKSCWGYTNSFKSVFILEKESTRSIKFAENKKNISSSICINLCKAETFLNLVAQHLQN